MHTERLVHLEFEHAADYTSTPEELRDFLVNRSIYGGYTNFSPGTLYGQTVSICNMGCYVGKKGEPSLDRFLKQVLRTRRGNVAQQLLDFVTQQLRYDHSEADSGLQFCKRPNEVLMGRGGTCAGLAVCYASLLEQAGLDYCLIYIGKTPATISHIAVGVAWPDKVVNGLEFTWRGVRYALAETTSNGFRIGIDRVGSGSNPLTPDQCQFVQKPGEQAYRLTTDEPAPWR